MVIRSLILFFYPAVLSAATPDLHAGREALQRADIREALKAYRNIPPGHPLWADKLEDLTRYHLQKNQPLEAWRITQLARRTGHHETHWSDYEQLAVLQGGGCPIALEGGTPGRSLLLQAATYRLRASLFQGENTASNTRPDERHFGPGQVPHLRDIPNTEIRRGQGCRLEKMLAKGLQGDLKRSLAERELQALMGYLRLHSKNDQADLLILIRALELAQITQDDKAIETLRRNLQGIEHIAWENLPEPERQWVFSQLFKANKRLDLPEEKRMEAQNLALRILEIPDSSPRWLAFVDIDSLPPEQRHRLFALVEKRGPAFERGWILYKWAESLNQEGDPHRSLGILRRLLVEGEEKITPNLQNAAIRLAGEIFAEYRLSHQMMGAMEAAIPFTLWKSLVQSAMKRSAINGLAHDFHALSRVGRISDSESTRWSVWRSLAQRRLQQFRRGLDGIDIIRFAEDFSLHLNALASIPGDLTPYRKEISRRLQQQFPTGSPQNERAMTLAQILQEPSSDRVLGNRSVRQGILLMGVVEGNTETLLTPSFELQPPKHLPRRELIFTPAPDQERAWLFSTVIR